MGWLIAAGILVLIAILPVGVRALYNEDGPLVYLTAGPLRIPLYPGNPEKDKKKKEKKKPKESKTAGKKTQTKKRKGGSIQDFLPLVDKVLDFLGAFRRKLRVTNLQLKLVLADADPCDLAVHYGKGWAILGNLMPLLENVFVIKTRDMEVECDFLAEKTSISARLDLSITIGRLVSLLVVQGIPALKTFINIMNKRKGGAKA